MTTSRTCPACGAHQTKVVIYAPRPYGQYRRIECHSCNHRWTERDPTKGTPPAPRQQCPECSSTNTEVIESRIQDYGRRQRVVCHDCSHRWTKRISDQLVPRGQRRREQHLTEDDVRSILTSPLGMSDKARVHRISKETVRKILRGQLHANVAAELPRLPARPRKRSCTSCSFWDRESVRPCGLGWPDPETFGPGYANECGDYSPKREGLLRTPTDGGLRRG